MKIQWDKRQHVRQFQYANWRRRHWFHWPSRKGISILRMMKRSMAFCCNCFSGLSNHSDGLMQHLVTAVVVRHPMLEWAPHLPQKSNLALHVLRFIGVTIVLVSPVSQGTTIHVSLYKLGEVAVENGQIASHSTVELLDMMLV